MHGCRKRRFFNIYLCVVSSSGYGERQSSGSTNSVHQSMSMDGSGGPASALTLLLLLSILSAWMDWLVGMDRLFRSEEGSHIYMRNSKSQIQFGRSPLVCSSQQVWDHLSTARYFFSTFFFFFLFTLIYLFYILMRSYYNELIEAILYMYII